MEMGLWIPFSLQLLFASTGQPIVQTAKLVRGTCVGSDLLFVGRLCTSASLQSSLQQPNLGACHMAYGPASGYTLPPASTSIAVFLVKKHWSYLAGYFHFTSRAKPTTHHTFTSVPGKQLSNHTWQRAVIFLIPCKILKDYSNKYSIKTYVE